MHLFDPARPKAGHFPAYVFDNQVIGPMPSAQITPLEDGVFQIDFMLLVQPHTGRYFSIKTLDVNSVLAQFVASPEEFFVTCLNYQPPKVKTKKMKEDEILASIFQDLKI